MVCSETLLVSIGSSSLACDGGAKVNVAKVSGDIASAKTESSRRSLMNLIFS